MLTTPTYTALPFAAREARAAVGGMGIEGKITPQQGISNTIYAPRGAATIRHVTVQNEGLSRAFLRADASQPKHNL